MPPPGARSWWIIQRVCTASRTQGGERNEKLVDHRRGMAGDRLHRFWLLELAVRARRRRMDRAVRRLEPGPLEPDRQRQLAACRGRRAGRQRQRLSRVEEL